MFPGDPDMVELVNIGPNPHAAEMIAALGEVEQRLQAIQQAAQGNSVINLGFGRVTDSGNIMTTKKTVGERSSAAAGTSWSSQMAL